MLAKRPRRKCNQPRGFGVEIGSVGKRESHAQQHSVWHWGVDIMPLMDHGGRPSTGNADTFEAALEAFKTAFLEWHAGIDPETWQRNRDHINATDRW